MAARFVAGEFAHGLLHTIEDPQNDSGLSTSMKTCPTQSAVGSAAVATGIYTSCGTRMVDVLGFAARHRVDSEGVREVLLTRPIIYDHQRNDRRGYAALAYVHA